MNNHDKQQTYSVSEYMYQISIVIQFPVLLPFSRKGNPTGKTDWKSQQSIQDEVSHLKIENGSIRNYTCGNIVIKGKK